MDSMKTTLEIPDELFREAKARAALEGRKLKDLVADGLRAVLAAKAAGGKPRHIKFPVLKSRTKGPLAITDDAAYRAELLDDVSRHEAALR